MNRAPRKSIPRFEELPVREGAPPNSSWGVFGDDDDIGTLNFIGPEEVLAAAGLVRRGKVFALNWDVTLPSPAFFNRQNVRHTIFAKYEGKATDDYLDAFWPQASSQWDGLRHMADAEGNFYNFATIEDVARPGPGRLGMEHWARRGIAGRGVLLDVVRAVARSGEELDPFEFFAIGSELLEQVADDQEVEMRAGDILLLRVGWVEAYERLTLVEREAYVAEGPRPGHPGLFGAGVPAFLWDNRIAAIAADNPGLEAAHRAQGSDRALHHALIARLGMPLGELWDLRALAEDCAADGAYEFLLTSAPLNLPGGVGSPPNAVAIK